MANERTLGPVLNTVAEPAQTLRLVTDTRLGLNQRRTIEQSSGLESHLRQQTQASSLADVKNQSKIAFIVGVGYGAPCGAICLKVTKKMDFVSVGLISGQR